MKAYSEDLRQIVAVVERGMPKTKAAHLFGVSLSSVKRYVRMAREALVEALGMAISAVSVQHAQGFFEYCGYGASA